MYKEGLELFEAGGVIYKVRGDITCVSGIGTSELAEGGFFEYSCKYYCSDGTVCYGGVPYHYLGSKPY